MNRSVNGIVDLENRAKGKRQMSHTLQYPILDGQFVVYMPICVDIEVFPSCAYTIN